MDFDVIIDSHTHWGPSLTMGIDVTTGELQRQQKEAGITHVVLIPFPSTAIADGDINVRLLKETERVSNFIPYHYIREDYDRDGFDPIPQAFYGGKWHWMRGWQDSASNYKVLEDKALPDLVQKIVNTGKPVIFEEDLDFTIRFVEMFSDVTLIVPHLGLLGGNPYDFLRAFKDKESVYFDTALGSRDAMYEFIKTVGPHRLLFGSDVPFGTMKGELSKVLALSISRDDRDLLLYKNFMRLTGYESGEMEKVKCNMEKTKETNH